MGNERREIPTGFFWKKCPGADMLVPMPDTWFFIPSPVSGTFAYGFAPERTPNKYGFLDTALSINVMPKLQKQMNMSPEDLARRSLVENPATVPLGEIEVSESAHFVTARGRFTAPALKLAGMDVPPQWYNADHTVNKDTGTFYMFTFNTPLDQKEEYEEISEVMVGQRVLNRNF
ncbi:MAG TPA: hypothetical protein VG935_03945 [Patescibacteria group bacterium]|nr:hypothetical protein [Patescibacteria group bacterium]